MSEQATLEIAAQAARLVVEEGMDYAAAKRKAARDLGRRQGRSAELPSNEAVEDEVWDYLRLFCADTQPAELHHLRELAAVWMERLEAFRPHLGGAVWRGTATRLSAVLIDLYVDDPKAAEIAFINAGVDVESHGGEPNDGLGVLTVAEFSRTLNDTVTLHFIIHDHDDLRGALKPDSRGRSWRGDLSALRRLLSNLESPHD